MRKFFTILLGFLIGTTTATALVKAGKTHVLVSCNVVSDGVTSETDQDCATSLTISKSETRDVKWSDANHDYPNGQETGACAASGTECWPEFNSPQTISGTTDATWWQWIYSKQLDTSMSPVTCKTSTSSQTYLPHSCSDAGQENNW